MKRISMNVLTIALFTGIFACDNGALAQNDEKGKIEKMNLKTVWLDELDLSKVDGQAVKNMSVENKELSIGEKKFKRGVGVSAPTIIKLKLGGGAKRFTSWIGMDGGISKIVPGYLKIKYMIFDDEGTALLDCEVKPQDEPRRIDIDVSGVDVLELVVDASYLYRMFANWADAKIEFISGTPETVAIIKPAPYILTPKPQPEPRINSPKVFGVRPNNPVFYKIAATGEKPIKYSVLDMPAGLTCDSTTGVITGIFRETGKHKMTMLAENIKGKATKELSIIVGDKIALTPPMGWNSWNCWANNVDDGKIRDAAKAMVESGLIDFGWSYVNIDDAWVGDRNPQTKRISANNKFPDMKALAEYVHSLGLRIGLYTDCGPKTCAGFTGSDGFENEDIMSYAEWGFDYVKVDWGFCEGKIAEQAYSKFGVAIAKAPRDIVFSICEWGGNKPWFWGEKVGGNCWRTTGDIVDTWASLYEIGFSQAPLFKYAGPGHWNDPDMMIVGKVGWGSSLHDSRLTPDEQYMHVTLWSLLASPLLIGCDMTKLDDFTLNLLTNSEVIEVNQDPLGKQARQVRAGEKQLWVKDLEDSSVAVGLINTTKGKRLISFTQDEIGVGGKCRLRDLWRNKDVGYLDKEYTAEVPARGVVFLRVIPEK